MPQIVMSPHRDAPRRLDTGVKRAAYTFLEKLGQDDSVPGLHIEPINGAIDGRVRTGRVDKFYRAVLFKVQGESDEAIYVHIGVWPHDDAIDIAKKTRLSVNPVNGIAELITDTTSEAPSPVPAPPAPAYEPAALEGLLRAKGFDRQSLVDELGIDAAIAEDALVATTEDELMAVIERAVTWQGYAILSLAAGEPMSDVMEQFSIGAKDAPKPGAELSEALRHPAAQMQFAFIDDNAELRRAIEDDFAAWRLFLHPDQRRYVEARTKGPYRLSGGAGTGKTVVLMHRARELARRYPGESIVLTTFNRTLADQLRDDLGRLDPSLPIASALGHPGIYVSGVDKAVSDTLRTVTVPLDDAVSDVLGTRSAAISGRASAGAWQDAIDLAGDGLPEETRSPAFFAAEYAMVVLPNRITSASEYVRARRRGRGVPLDRRKRQAVWAVIESYRSRAAIDGSVDFPEAAEIAARALEESGPLVRHVLVDEGQDLHPSHWRFLRALVTPGADDMFIAEDAHQRIYGQHVVLGQHGIAIVGRSRRMTLNYRTTAQNLDFALRVLAGADYVDVEGAEEDEQTYTSARTGPTPDRRPYESLGAELEGAAETIREWLASEAEDENPRPESIGILVRDKRLASQVSRGLEGQGVSVRVVDGPKTPVGRPVVMTMHRAKGMEFSRVLLFDVTDANMPAQYLMRHLAGADREDALLRERSLLYVAATRARDELVVTWVGDRSQFLPE